MFKSLFLVSLLSFSTAFADHHEDGEKEMPGCKAEVEKICKEAGKDRKEKLKCIQENHSQFSPECQKKFEERKEAFKEVMEACEKDATELCPNESLGHGLMKCLKKNHKKLQDSCKSKIKEHKKNRDKNKN